MTVVGLYQTGKDGSEVSITPFGGYSEITGGSVPADMWTDYMTEAVKDLPEEDFPDLPTSVATKKATPTPTPTETEEPDEDVAVPSGIVGVSLSKARSALTAAGFDVSVVEKYSDSVAKGVVISASPGAGKKVSEGSTVTLTVSRGPRKETTPTPTPTPTPTEDSDAGSDNDGGDNQGGDSGETNDGDSGDTGGGAGTGAGSG